MNNDYDALTIAQSEMDAGENLLWAGRPTPGRSLGPAIPKMLVGIPVTGFAIFWIWGATGFGSGMPHASDPFAFFPLFGVPFVLIGLAMLTAPLWVYLKAGRTVYAVSSRRALIIISGRSRSVQSFCPQDMEGIRRTERADGSGDIYFAQQAGPYRGRPDLNYDTDYAVIKVGFTGIPDVRAVERILRDALKKEPDANRE